MTIITKNFQDAKPFVKWAGGKTQLLPVIRDNLPKKELTDGTIKKYIEPFVGSGALLFDIVTSYPQIEEVYIFDINPELINTYRVIKNNVCALISLLKKFENTFIPLNTEDRKKYYYEVREQFNENMDGFSINLPKKGLAERAAQFIFLNRTCFNGLYRVNKKGKFNVPMGQYKNPTICNVDNLMNTNKFLQIVSINLGDYKESENYIDSSSFVYFDPPYRPISKSSSFTSYSKFDFDDQKQIELSNYYTELSEKGAYLMLSNSDPKNIDSEDDFFDEIYKGFNINRVEAKRNINSKASKRGKITELLITNYQ